MAKEFQRLVLPSLKQAAMRKQSVVKFLEYQANETYHDLGNGKKYLVKTYGCQGNLADSEKLTGMLEEMGYEPAHSEQDADIIIFNTCAIRENAENRIFGELGRIKKIKKYKPDLILGICGCMPQEEAMMAAFKKRATHVDLIFGTHNISHLGEYLANVLEKRQALYEVWSVEGDIYEDIPVKRDHPTKAWVNIMYGCDEFCTYCIVPYTRGKERSRRPESIIAEVKSLIAAGYLEVTLLGQNVNAYGLDLENGKYRFADLLNDLGQLPIKRIRYTTSHPRDLDDATIMAMANHTNIMPHLHLPVQSGNNQVLKRMNRKYSVEEYLTKISKLKEAIPGISITTDIIVAFPGETEEQFQDTIKLVEAVQFEGAFTFIYSPRPGTPAAKYPNPLTEQEKKDRLLALNEHINKYSLLGNKRFENKVVKVLVEGFSKTNDQMLCGYSEHNKLVNFAGSPDLIGQIIDIKITKAYSWHLVGEVEN